MSSVLQSLIDPRKGNTGRQSSWDRTGGNQDYVPIPQGEEKVIFDLEGPAKITHIWCTVSSPQPYYYRSILLRMYWDDEETPSVEVPLGDFFGVGHGVASHYMSLPLNMVTRQDGPQPYSAMNCYFAMPFSKRGKIVVVNQTGADIPNFYYAVDYETLEELPENTLRFHAQWRRQNPTDGVLDMEELKRKHTRFKGPLEEISSLKNLDGAGNYVILEAKGEGHYVGCNLSIDHINPVPNVTWFGEGDDMIFIDGQSWPPTIHGTGTEDYFCAAWDYPSYKYDGPYHGISLAEICKVNGAWETPGAWGGGSFGYSGKWTSYRFHLEDPVIFHQSIKVTVEHGHANSLSNDYSSTAYWYQSEPHQPFPEMLPVELRMPLTTKESLSAYCKSI